MIWIAAWAPRWGLDEVIVKGFPEQVQALGSIAEWAMQAGESAQIDAGDSDERELETYLRACRSIKAWKVEQFSA